MRQPTTYIEQLKEIRTRALNDLPGTSKFSNLCMVLEEDIHHFFFRNRWYQLVQINPDDTLYAYCEEGDEMCHIKNDILPTPIVCELADIVNRTTEWKKPRYYYEKKQCHTKQFKDKPMKEIKK